MFAIIFHSLLHILIVLTPFLFLGYILYYEFAIIGMAIFRQANLTDVSAASECSTYENLKYYPYNFGDFGSSFVLLWNLMIVNNWHIIVHAYVNWRSSEAVRIYFVVWWLISETIINGVLFGVLLEILSNVTKGYFELLEKFDKCKSWYEKAELIGTHYFWQGQSSPSFNFSWNIYSVIAEEDGEQNELHNMV